MQNKPVKLTGSLNQGSFQIWYEHTESLRLLTGLSIKVLQILGYVIFEYLKS